MALPGVNRRAKYEKCLVSVFFGVHLVCVADAMTSSSMLKVILEVVQKRRMNVLGIDTGCPPFGWSSMQAKTAAAEGLV
jgi:hypothetical protein